MHYIKEEWQQYKEGKISYETACEMEEHLTDCDLCLENFLALIDDVEIEKSGNFMSADFTRKVIKKISTPPKHINQKSKDKKWFNEKAKSTIIYYIAAASITMIFMGSGVFQTIVEKGTEVRPEIISSRLLHDNQLSLDFSDNVVNQASIWIRNFEANRRSLNEKE